MILFTKNLIPMVRYYFDVHLLTVQVLMMPSYICTYTYKCILYINVQYTCINSMLIYKNVSFKMKSIFCIHICSQKIKCKPKASTSNVHFNHLITEYTLYPITLYFCFVESVVIMPKAKRSKSLQPKLKSLSLFYNKVCELVSLLGDLVDIQSLTDTDILQVCVISQFAVQFVTYMLYVLAQQNK